MSYSRIDGPEDAPVVLLSNSMGTTLEMWEPQMPALTAHYAVLRYDHPGHGHGRGEAPLRSVEGLARAVLGIFDERSLARVSFCGLSLGGAVGMWLAMHAPERIDRLVLACTAARFGTRERWQQRIATVRDGGMEAVADAVLPLLLTEQTRADAPALVRAHRAMMITAESEGYAGCCEALCEWDPGDALAAIAAPTLVIAGSEDSATPPQLGEVIQRQVPGARMSVIPGAGHLANIERPDEFNELLLGHLTTRPVLAEGGAA